MTATLHMVHPYPALCCPAKMPVKLYPHPIAALHSLLQLHLPYSLSLYGTAFATPPPPSSQPRTAVPAVAPRLIWTTFQTVPTYPNASSPNSWTAIIAYPAPDRQIRIYNSLEHPSISKTTAPDARPSYVDAAQRQVVGAIEAYIRDVDPGMPYVGKVHELWLDAVEGYIAGRAAGGLVGQEETWEISQDGTEGQKGVKAAGAAVEKETCLSRPIDLGKANVALRSRSKWKKQGRYWVWCPPWELPNDRIPAMLPDGTYAPSDFEVEGYEVDIGRNDDLAAVRLHTPVVLSILEAYSRSSTPPDAPSRSVGMARTS